MNYVPVDPCQAVIMGVRVAMGEGITRAYIDREEAVCRAPPFISPDAYVLKRLSYAAFAAAMVSTLTPPVDGSQQQARIAWMAFQLHELEMEYDDTLPLSLCRLALDPSGLSDTTDLPGLRTVARPANSISRRS